MSKFSYQKIKKSRVDEPGDTVSDAAIRRIEHISFSKHLPSPVESESERGCFISTHQVEALRFCSYPLEITNKEKIQVTRKEKNYSDEINRNRKINEGITIEEIHENENDADEMNIKRIKYCQEEDSEIKRTDEEEDLKKKLREAISSKETNEIFKSLDLWKKKLEIGKDIMNFDYSQKQKKIQVKTFIHKEILAVDITSTFADVGIDNEEILDILYLLSCETFKEAHEKYREKVKGLVRNKDLKSFTKKMKLVKKFVEECGIKLEKMKIGKNKKLTCDIEQYKRIEIEIFERTMNSVPEKNEKEKIEDLENEIFKSSETILKNMNTLRNLRNEPFKEKVENKLKELLGRIKNCFNLTEEENLPQKKIYETKINQLEEVLKKKKIERETQSEEVLKENKNEKEIMNSQQCKKPDSNVMVEKKKEFTKKENNEERNSQFRKIFKEEIKKNRNVRFREKVQMIWNVKEGIREIVAKELEGKGTEERYNILYSAQKSIIEMAKLKNGKKESVEEYKKKMNERIGKIDKKLSAYNKLIHPKNQEEKLYYQRVLRCVSKENANSQIIKLKDLKNELNRRIGARIWKENKDRRNKDLEVNGRIRNIKKKNLTLLEMKNIGEHYEFWKRRYEEETEMSIQQKKELEELLRNYEKPSVENSLEIDDEEIRMAYKFMGSSKAPGPNGVSTKMAKIFLKENNPKIKENFNKWLNHPESIPEEMISGKTILFNKKNNDSLDPNDFRPITLLNENYKCLTSILYERILKKCLEKGLLDPNQVSGIKGKDGLTESHQEFEALRFYVKRIARNTMVTLYIDFEKAFDSIYHEAVKMILTKTIGESKEIRLLFELMKKWNIRLYCPISKRLTEAIRIRRGIYQGDKISPFLFNLTISIIKKIGLKGLKMKNGSMKNEISYISYADDIKLVSRNKEEMNENMKILEKTAEMIGLKMNYKKCATQTVLGARRTAKDRVISERENKEFSHLKRIEERSTYTYLGINERDKVVFTDNESFLKEAKKRIKKIIQKNILTYLIRKGLAIYVNPLIRFAAINMKIPKKEIRSLNQFLRKTLIINGYIRRSSSNWVIFKKVENGGLGIMNFEEVEERAIEYAKKIDDQSIEMNSARFITKERCRNLKYENGNFVADRLERKYEKNERNNKEEKNIPFYEIKKKEYEEKPKSLYERVLIGEFGKIDKDYTCSAIKNNYLKKEEIARFLECSEERAPLRCYLHKIGLSRNDLCRRCRSSTETVNHVLSGCIPLFNIYKRRHDEIVLNVINTLIKRNNMKREFLSKIEETRGLIIENEDFKIQSDVRQGKEIRFNFPDIVFIKKKENEKYIIDVGIAGITMINETVNYKKNKYTELARSEKKYKTFIIPLILGNMAISTSYSASQFRFFARNCLKAQSRKEAEGQSMKLIKESNLICVKYITSLINLMCSPLNEMKNKPEIRKYRNVHGKNEANEPKMKDKKNTDHIQSASKRLKK